MLTKKKLQKNHLLFCHEILGLKQDQLQSYQNKIADSVFNQTRTCVQSCHCMGKTYTAALTILSYFFTHPNTTVISTAPTVNLLQNQLWAEIRSHYKSSPVDFECKLLDGKCELRIDDKWFALGFVPRKDLSASQSDFQGFHNDYILIVFDEATGIPKKIWDMAESMMTSANVRFLALGNPTDPTSEFANIFKSPMWNKIKISCFDSPNVYENGITNIQQLRDEFDYLKTLEHNKRFSRIRKYKKPFPYLLTLEFVIEALFKWGEDSPWFQARILGEFPRISDDTLIAPVHIEEAM